jgi:hypothetical protein
MIPTSNRCAETPDGAESHSIPGATGGRAGTESVAFLAPHRWDGSSLGGTLERSATKDGSAEDGLELQGLAEVDLVPLVGTLCPGVVDVDETDPFETEKSEILTAKGELALDDGANLTAFADKVGDNFDLRGEAEAFTVAKPRGERGADPDTTRVVQSRTGLRLSTGVEGKAGGAEGAE